MMKFMVIFALIGLMSVGVPARAASPNRIRILKNDFQSDGVGNYGFSYETENGISHNEEGHVENDEGKIVRGSYSYTGDDGVIYTVEYYADENGFHASGAHLPGSNSGSSFGARKTAPKAFKAPRPAVSTKLTGYPYEKPSIAYLPYY